MSPPHAESAAGSPLILAVDAATEFYSVALSRGAQLLAETACRAPRRHATRLIPVAESVLREADTAFEALDLIAVSRGPGSFTGVRIGISTCQGWALALGIPLLGVDTLDAVAAGVPVHGQHLCVLLDAKMNEVFAAVYQANTGPRWNRIAGPCVAPLERALRDVPEDATFVGDGALRFHEALRGQRADALILPEAFAFPRASGVARLAAEQWFAHASGELPPVEPVYLRGSQPEEARRCEGLPRA